MKKKKISLKILKIIFILIVIPIIGYLIFVQYQKIQMRNEALSYVEELLKQYEEYQKLEEQYQPQKIRWNNTCNIWKDKTGCIGELNDELCKSYSSFFSSPLFVSTNPPPKEINSCDDLSLDHKVDIIYYCCKTQIESISLSKNGTVTIFWINKTSSPFLIR